VEGRHPDWIWQRLASITSADGRLRVDEEMDQAPERRQTIGLVAHDHKKTDLIEWAKYNRLTLIRHDLVATGTTGTLLEEELGIGIVKLQSGPLGGDQQLGALIAEGAIDLLVFFWDPLEQQPHDPDVRALLRLAVVWNIPVACNRATADFVISSPLMGGDYERQMPDYHAYIDRFAESIDESGTIGDEGR